MQSEFSTPSPTDDAQRRDVQRLLTLLASPQFYDDLDRQGFVQHSTGREPSKPAHWTTPPVTTAKVLPQAAKAKQDYREAVPLPTGLRLLERSGHYVGGFVYVATDGSGLFKIGMTTDPVQRKDSATAWNLRLIFLVFWKCADPRGVELGIHKALVHRSRGREWFALSSPEVEELLSAGEIPIADMSDAI